jgi:hypothetical protein
VSVRFRDMIPFQAAVLGTVIACLVASEATGAWRIWIVGAVVGAGIVLGTGHAYRKAVGDAA